jgi:hypothetical protein
MTEWLTAPEAAVRASATARDFGYATARRDRRDGLTVSELLHVPDFTILDSAVVSGSLEDGVKLKAGLKRLDLAE